MARKTKARAVLDRQKAEEKPMIAKKVGDGKDKALKIKGIVRVMLTDCTFTRFAVQSKSDIGTLLGTGKSVTISNLTKYLNILQ